MLDGCSYLTVLYTAMHDIIGDAAYSVKKTRPLPPCWGRSHVIHHTKGERWERAARTRLSALELNWHVGQLDFFPILFLSNAKLVANTPTLTYTIYTKHNTMTTSLDALKAYVLSLSVGLEKRETRELTTVIS